MEVDLAAEVTEVESEVVEMEAVEREVERWGRRRRWRWWWQRGWWRRGRHARPGTKRPACTAAFVNAARVPFVAFLSLRMQVLHSSLLSRVRPSEVLRQHGHRAVSGAGPSHDLPLPPGPSARHTHYAILGLNRNGSFDEKALKKNYGCLL